MQILKKNWIYIAICVYLLFVIIYTAVFSWINKDSLVLLQSNELGDFLAGTFAPLSFFILIIGFIQQGKEFKKSEEHRIKEQEYLHRQAQPEFIFTSIYVGERVDSVATVSYFAVEFQVENIGNEATQVHFALKSTNNLYTVIEPRNISIFNRRDSDNKGITLKLWLSCDIPTETQEFELIVTYTDARRIYQVLNYDMLVMPPSTVNFINHKGFAHLQLKDN